MNRLELILGSALLFCSTAGFAQQQAEQNSGMSEPLYSLTVHVKGAEQDTGQILASVFSSEQDFLKKPKQEATADIESDGSAHLTFTNLTPGIYAVSAIYDKDMNGKLNTGFLGIPKELIGFSNNARGRFGPPPFNKVSFELSESQIIVVSLRTAKSKK